MLRECSHFGTPDVKPGKGPAFPNLQPTHSSRDELETTMSRLWLADKKFKDRVLDRDSGTLIASSSAYLRRSLATKFGAANQSRLAAYPGPHRPLRLPPGELYRDQSQSIR